MTKWEILLNHDHSQRRVRKAGANYHHLFNAMSHGWVVVADFEADDIHAAMVIADAMSPSYRNKDGNVRFYDPRRRN
jgi:hypothetical protein